jgi:riboflavin synthase
MFTGIVEELGRVVSVDHGNTSASLSIAGPLVTSDCRPGDSIAVNGVCLTVTDTSGAEFTADVMDETLRRSNLGELRVGTAVNLERPLTLSARLGGHLVQGHVDATARLLDRTPGENWEVVRFELPQATERYVVEKGSITVDGVSLTVAARGDDWFSVSLIPTTLELTTLGRKEPGEQVNLEVDVIAKYVERMLPGGPS